MAGVRGTTRSLALALAALGVATPAAAADPARLAVLPDVIGGEQRPTSASELFRVVEAAIAQHPGVDVAPYDELLAGGSDALSTRARACASDLECLARALDRDGFTLGLRVIANVALDPALVSLSLVPADGRAAVERLTEVTDRATLEEALTREVHALLDQAGLPRGGRVSVSVQPPGALVDVRGQREGAAPGVFVVPSGRITITAHHEDHEPKSVDVDVAPGAELGVELVLDRRAGLTSSPWFWAVVGAVTAAAATSAILVATDPFDDAPRTGCVCVTTASGVCPPCP
ncbi:hypothetical protein L6R52_26650 [Myxococcota bacterium]|nr:hypothetical protein [Myxococcota bacterium]